MATQVKATKRRGHQMAEKSSAYKLALSEARAETAQYIVSFLSDIELDSRSAHDHAGGKAKHDSRTTTQKKPDNITQD